jgi:hypothetical protein
MLADFEADRVTNKVNDIAEAKVLVINNTSVSELSAYKAELEAFYKGGGFVILVEPTPSELTTLSSWTGAHVSVPQVVPSKPDGLSVPD